MPEQIEFVTVTKAAAQIGISERQTYNLIRQGLLLAEKIGSARVIKSLVLEKFIRERNSA